MNQHMIQSVSEEVYRRFPEMKGKKPKVQAIKPPAGRSISRGATYLLIFQNQVSTGAQKTMPLNVRVVANDQGKILKITMSH